MWLEVLIALGVFALSSAAHLKTQYLSYEMEAYQTRREAHLLDQLRLMPEDLSAAHCAEERLTADLRLLVCKAAHADSPEQLFLL